MTVSTGHVDMSGEFKEDVDYKAVCEQLQFENEGLRATLDRLNRFTDTMEDVRHILQQVGQTFRKNPYLLVVVCYIVLSILDFILRRTNHEG